MRRIFIGTGQPAETTMACGSTLHPSFDRVAAAHERSESGHPGGQKLVLREEAASSPRPDDVDMFAACAAGAPSSTWDPWAVTPIDGDERFSNAERLRSEWETYLRRWRRFRLGCYSTAVVGLALIFFDLILPGVAIVAVAVGGVIAWQNFDRRERAHWQLLGAERSGEIADRPSGSEDDENQIS